MQKTCKQCGSGFEVTEEDMAFYDKVSPVFGGKKYQIPPPTLCSDCRQQKRMTFRNERKLYKDKCDLTGKEMVSCFPPESSLTVYSQEAFWSDKWDPKELGRDYDFSKSFFQQMSELIASVPQIALLNTQTENSEFCHRIYDGRNNYMSIIALYAPENLLYTYYTMTCKDSTDTAFNQYCELCYETIDAEHCYNCLYGLRIRNCKDSYFLEDCIGCTNCFGCKNLHQKQYCIFNEQKTKDEYDQFIQSCAFGSLSAVKKMRKECDDFFLKLPNRPKMMIDAEGVTGADVYHCRDSIELYDWYESERMTFCALGEKSHDCMDCYGMGYGEFCYDSITIQYTNHSLFCATVINTNDLIYCYECYADSSSCFGCSSMKKGKYCILNKQYSKDEYEELVPKIIEHMQSTGEWGEFFPIELSPFAYNETVAQEYFPLTKEEVEANDWKWRDEKDEIPKVEKIIKASQLPDSIDDIPDDVLNWAIECEVTSRPFRIVKQELEFYRRMKLPIPHLHPDERHKRRMALRNPRKLWNRQCDKCGKDIQTTYAPERPETVYCEECYLKEVY